MTAAAPVFPGYRVLGLVGQGGMGQVFQAEDEVLGRKVAIKTILPAVSGEGEARQRFLREARSMATVEHPRVVRVYSFGETAGQAYFVMEYVDGETLAARLARTPRLAVDEALGIARETAEALAAAWQRGIVHRDVKPSNIILDREGHVHVADFGLARAAEPRADSAVTHSGAFVGSPHYVAPEQARALPTDFRSDIYSLGIVLFEMLAGHRPFDGRSVMDVISGHLNEPTPPVRQWAPDIPADVDQLVRSMTEKDPTLRPASYPTLIASLSGRTLPGELPSAPTTTMPTVPVSRRRGRQRWLTLGIAAGLAAVSAAAWYAGRPATRLLPRPPGDLVVAVAPFYGPDEASAKEGGTMAALVESELRRLAGDEEGRTLGLATLDQAARGAPEARRLGTRQQADVIVWGEALAFQGEVEVQPVLTRVGEGPAPPRLVPILLGTQQGNVIEFRRRGAARVAEAVVRVAARQALDRGQPEAALRLLQECRPLRENLLLRAEALDRVGRTDEAAAARREAETPTS